MAKIKGGYYIKARCIQDSEISVMPPYIREIWDWLLKEANHSERKINGSVIERGQLKRSFRDIQEGLKWMVGWRKMTYKKWQCENAMIFLRKRAMITTTKTTRGMLITINNYLLYQDPKNYESNKRTDRRTTDSKQTTDTINKNDKNVKNEEEIKEIKEVRNQVSASLKEKSKANNIEFDQELLSWHGVDEDIIEDWEKRFPNINIGEELMKIREYFKKNPGKEGDKRNYAILINDWLERAEKYKSRGVK